jgi:hypothetical protein
MTTPVGVSILTNGARCEFLRNCIDSFLANCYYRPLVIGILDNGSTDDTSDFISRLPKVYGVTWRPDRNPTDLGCAVGTNMATAMVKDCEFALHLESDFIHMTEDESGVGRLWMQDAIRFMQTGVCDYLYLRRMCNEHDMRMHWWAQWMPKVIHEVGPYLSCPEFWWSNNPALRRVQALYDCKTLPLDESKDGKKGQSGWSQPELRAPRPTKPWIYHWGMFKHEGVTVEFPEQVGCGKFGPFGTSTCKYGFYKLGWDSFCDECHHSKSFGDMLEHEKRYREKK